MSPASKSKSKASSKAVKEQQKASSKPSSMPASVGNVPANAYNPISGTFHSLETAPPASSPTSQNNGMFRTTDENEDHPGSFGTVADYDSVSNNDSCSGESEDQKDKMVTGTIPRPEIIPGCDTDKRDKIRQKNEKKHQRQKERRAQELLERCTGYLMSRKLEALSQQLVAMGFPAERATMALMLNEGRVEDSVSWLFEGGIDEEQLKATKQSNMANLKIDISDEIAKIAEMEQKFKCSKQEVERVILACEGDLEKAADALKAQKQESPATSPKLVESSHPPINGSNEAILSKENPVTRVQGKPVASVTIQQPRRDERDHNYPNVMAVGSAFSELGNKSLEPRRIQLKTDRPGPQLTTQVEMSWPNASSGPSVSYSASPLQVTGPPVKAELRYAVSSSDVKSSLQAGALREMALLMQQPQSSNTKQNLPSSCINSNMLPPTVGWNPNGSSSIDMMKLANGSLGQNRISQRLGNPGPSQPFYPQNHYQQFVSSSVDASTGASGWGNSWSNTGPGTSSGTSSSIAVSSSLGLFTGWGTAGSSGSSSPGDWSMDGSMLQCDYNSIDWSMDLTPNLLKSLKPDCNKYGTWSTAFVGVKSAMQNMNRVHYAGFQEGGFAMEPSAGQREWTSPFAGKDIFSLSRQFVTSPYL